SWGDRPRRAGRDELVKEAGRDTALGQYLSAVPKKRSLDLYDIVDGIAQGESKLSETERVFMLMNEIKKVYTKQ
ncbi:MAG TPA: hypothetical protein VN260_05650, partial [Dissulfurispiraceae bacterium]|nr:hypothetical protein [Dissulfurispiraceae bacterium]